MTRKKLKKELRKYTLTEKLLFVFNILLAGLIIFLSQKLIQTSFGRASLAFGISMLGLTTIFRALKVWGPKE